ncbi:DUF1800 domain-containing protein [Pelomonas sp. SE-A7]|uniref:DUF1800 domain-containing protein n=1 Tax=Pelomonas sp. SE-A7 TaxID=3054953 RepID=UPI00259D2427|nr:DUF1800 domain-containing protein [Pelomonas sp. SE-A7]MDM4768053.1 DUF1800 domain-containing protein [Pelomonas sp. SE-A7]
MASTLPLAGLGWSQGAAPLSAEEKALHALNRLAYGPRPGDVAAMRSLGAERWLQAFLAAQFEPASAAAPEALKTRLAGLDTQALSQAELIGRYREATQANRANRREAAATMEANKDAGKDDNAKTEAARANARRELVRPVLQQTAQARLARAIESPAQLEEVLVEFWFNHFNVFAGKGPVSVLVGAYEREAIRPFVFGRFRDMLAATAKHPAMLVYLDNVQSVKPGYQPPQRLARANPNAQRLTGLNENYARELMELHTLGVDGGYSQQDVTELARMLTGWTVDYRAAQRGSKGPLFEFDPRRHDNGNKQWLGRAVKGAGQAEGEMALDVLAAHPSTAKHIAFKLAQAFVADQPPPALVRRLADKFQATQGELKAVTRALVESDEFWSREAYGAKFKTPYHYLVSSLRALDATTPPDVQPLTQLLAQAGMPLYGWQTPDGYKNVASSWMNPEALSQRVQFASTLSERRARRSGLPAADAQGLMSTLGPLLSESTRKNIAAEPANLQVALLLGSPDFMKR